MFKKSIPINAAPLPPHASVRKWWVMLGVGLGVLMFTLDTSIVNVALPSLVTIFQTNFATIQWVILSYLLVINTLVLGAARLGDMWGKKPLYLAGLGIFTFSSLLCGLAPDVGGLIAFRALQGVGAMIISALGAAIVTEVFPSSERGKALGTIAAIVSIGVALGPSVGGILMGVWGWRSLFLVNVPIGLFATWIVIRDVPLGQKNPVKQRFDWLGMAVLTLTLSAFALGMTTGQNQGFGSALTLSLLAIALLGLGGFVAIETRIKQPLLDLSLFVNRKFSLSLLTSVLVFLVIYGIVVIIPFFLELALHYPIQRVGMLLAFSPILAGIVAPFSGSLSDRFGSRMISLMGLILMVIGSFAISTFNENLTDLGYFVRVAPYGIGFGMFQSPNNSVILGEVPPERLGIASGLMSLSRTSGKTIGLSVMATLFAIFTLSQSSVLEVTQASPNALIYGVQWTFRISAIVLLIATLVVAKLWKMETPTKS